MEKKECISAWLDAVRPFGDVLEIGSGVPESLIQAFRLKSYRKIDQEPWQTALPRLGNFDFILYSRKVLDKGHAEEGTLLLKEGKKALKQAEEMVPGLTAVRYTDHDLEAFCGQLKEAQMPFLSRFLSDLLDNGQITEEQHEKLAKKYHLKKEATKKVAPVEDHLFECIQECLKHMQKRSRFSCLIGDHSKYDDPRFFEHFIANPSLDYQEKPCGNSNYLLIEVL
jgi:hypothetical protein